MVLEEEIEWVSVVEEYSLTHPEGKYSVAHNYLDGKQELRTAHKTLQDAIDTAGVYAHEKSLRLDTTMGWS
ncbi:MAG: hypothetical protein ACXABY_12135 [Candidatus Thorarchaeota archaeon]|jgi:hypothetical protein